MASWFTKRDPYTSQKQKVLWWQPPFGIPERAKGLDAWLKTDPILYGEKRDGERWHKEQAIACIAEFRGGVMRFVNEKYGRKDILESTALFAPSVARRLRTPVEDEEDDDDARSVMSTATTASEISHRSGTYLTIRALFAKDPFGT